MNLSKNKKMFIVFSSFTILYFGSAFYKREQLFRDYQLAINKIENNSYQEAINIFSKLGDYKDSIKYIEFAKSCIIYEEAIQSFENEDYRKAVELFSQLDNFQNSNLYISKSEKMLEEYTIMERLYTEAYELYNCEKYQESMLIFSELGGYKDSLQMFQKCNDNILRLQHSTTISAGIRLSAALSESGKVYLSGANNFYLIQEVEDWNDIVSISTKGNFIIGLKKDGTVLYAGEKGDSKIDTSIWHDIISISAGEQYFVGLNRDGTLIAQGHNGDGQADISQWSDIVQVTTGWRHTVALDSHGQIYITGYNSKKQLQQIANNQENWNDIIAISAGGGSPTELYNANCHTVALCKDGTVVAVGDNDYGQCNVENWNDIIAISTGDNFTVGLKKDGTVVTTQTGLFFNELNYWNNIVSISCGTNYVLGLKNDGTVITTGYNHDGQLNEISTWNNIKYNNLNL